MPLLKCYIKQTTKSGKLWINRGIAASLPGQSVQDETSARHRRSSSISTGTLCLPSTPDELSTQFQSLKVVNRIQMVPIMYKDALINVGMSAYVSRILSNQTLARCIKAITIDEDLNRYPPYLLVTECDLEKEGCSDVRLKNKVLADDMFGVSVLKKVDDSCRLFTFLCVGVIIFNLLVTGCSSFPIPEHSSQRDYTPDTSNGTIAVPLDSQQNNTELPPVNYSAEEKSAPSPHGRVSNPAGSESASSSNKEGSTLKRHVSTTASIIPTTVVTVSNPEDPCQPPKESIENLERLGVGEANYASIMSMNELLQDKRHDDMDNETIAERGSYHVYTNSYFQSIGERNCEAMERILKNSSPKEVLCPWTYNCTYDRERYPKYIVQAECKQAECTKGCNSKEKTHCAPVTPYRMKVLKVKNAGACLNGSPATWEIRDESIHLGCECVSSI
uniref:Uncharacterized protein n=1 Tax=Amphimedon queenslandica TaxID=400682 RepID=A0A1X7VXB1_AMPQE